MNKPTGVIFISILYFIGAAFCLLGGIFFIAGGGILAGLMNQNQAGGAGADGLIAGLRAVAAVVCFVFLAIYLLVAVGLLKLKSWARIVAIIFSGLSVGFQLISLLRIFAHFNAVSAVITLAVLGVNALIIWYLLKPEIKAAFEGRQVQTASA